MDYSMFARPKLHNAKGIKYYPEYEFPVDQNYHHPNQYCHSIEHIDEDYLPADTPRKHRNQKGPSMKTRVSSERKCPIYVHPIPPAPDNFSKNLTQNTYKKVTNYLNDLHNVEQEPNITNNGQRIAHHYKKTADKTKKAVLTKLEESYWAHWKPQKEPVRNVHPEKPSTSRERPQHKRSKCKPRRRECEETLQTATELYCHQELDNQEIQTELSVRDAETVPMMDEEANHPFPNECGDENQMMVDNDVETPRDTSSHVGEKEETKTEVLYTSSCKQNGTMDVDEDTARKENPTDIVLVQGSNSSEMIENCADLETNRLKHTDSLILTKSKKQSEDRKNYQQPRCIRLYKKPGPSTTTTFVRGGTYPLKSCLKKESSFGCKRNIRLGRPGSPLIVTSNYYNTFQRSFKK